MVQSLDVRYFDPFRRKYYTEVNSRSRYSVTQVRKETIVLAFCIKFDK